MKQTIGIGLLFFLVFLGNIRGQGRFMDSTYVWTEFTVLSQFGDHTFTKRYTFDSSPTLINGKEYYQKLVSSSPSGSVWSPTNTYYRSDASAKVYLTDFGNEELIYDYSLNVQDTFFYPNGFGPFLIVDHIDTILLENGEKRKRLALRCSFDDDPPNGWGYSYWIEGLGGLNGVYGFSLAECSFDGIVPITLCISRNDTLLYQNMNYDSCWFIPTATKDLKSDLISIFPNPASTQISIDCKDHLIQNASVIDLLGNVIFIGNNSPLDISSFPPGYYFLRVESENKQLIMKRFVKQ
jgi:hypothetical protein